MRGRPHVGGTKAAQGFTVNHNGAGTCAECQNRSASLGCYEARYRCKIGKFAVDESGYCDSWRPAKRGNKLQL